MQENLVHIFYRWIVQRLSGTGLSRFGPLATLHQFVTRQFKSPKVDVHEFTMHLDSDDDMDLSFYGEFEPAETAIVQKYLKPGDTAIDIGAHIGYYTLLMSRLVSTNGLVVAFEPAPRNLEILRRNVDENAVKNATIHPTAVGSKPGMGRLYLSTNSVDHHLFDAEESRESILVNTTSLDEHFAGTDINIDFIKMDIQGGEAEAIRGMTGLMEAGRIKTILFEFWPQGLCAAEADAKELIQVIESLNYRIEEVQPDGLASIDITALLKRFTPENGLHTNLLARRRE